MGGICLGLQMAVIEYCRNVLLLSGANSTEIDKECAHPAVIFMPEGDKEKMGGTMRLGSRQCNLANKSLAKYLYGGKDVIFERHRHRYEVNPELVAHIEAKGLLFTGKCVKNERMEIIELPLSEHPFFFWLSIPSRIQIGSTATVASISRIDEGIEWTIVCGKGICEAVWENQEEETAETVQDS